MRSVDWSKWTAIAEIVSSVAIVVTLIYLTIQTQQNSEAILANSRNATVASDLSVIQSMIEYPEIELAMYKTSWTPEEMSRIENWLVALVRTREHQWFQYRDGLLDEQIWEAYLTGVTVNMSFPATRAWWDFVKYDYFDDEFVEALDVRLATTPVVEDLRPTLEKALEASVR